MALTYYAGTEGNFINLNVPNGEPSAIKNYSISIPAGTYNVTVPSRVNSVKIGNVELNTSGVINLSTPQTSASVEINYLPTSWTTRAVPSGTLQRFLTFGNGIFVGITNSGAAVYTSTDGLTWTTRDAFLGTAGATQSGAVTFGKNTFVAVGGYRPSGSGLSISTSTDGINWTTRTSASGTSEAIAITFNGSTFITGIRNSTPSPGVQRSFDGVSWTAHTVAMSSNASIKSIGSSKETGVVVLGGTSGQMASSANNGQSWTTRTSGFGTSGINGIAYGNGIWVAGGNVGIITTSEDAITWTARTSGLSTSNNILNVKFNNGYFIAPTNLEGNILISTNGINWILGNNNGASQSVDTEYGNGKWVSAVGSNIMNVSDYINPINTTVQLEYKGIGA
jgi:hypothetical protein